MEEPDIVDKFIDMLTLYGYNVIGATEYQQMKGEHSMNTVVFAHQSDRVSNDEPVHIIYLQDVDKEAGINGSFFRVYISIINIAMCASLLHVKPARIVDIDELPDTGGRIFPVIKSTDIVCVLLRAMPGDYIEGPQNAFDKMFYRLVV